MTTVLHLTHTNIPTDARILRELNALSQVPGLEIHAYGVLDGEPDYGKRSFTLREFRVRSARASRLPRPVRYALVIMEVNARFLARMMRLRPDVVHCHDTMVLPSGALARMLRKPQIVYDAHELESNKAGQSQALSRATLRVERACWPHIDSLITVSPSIARWYSEHLGAKPTACILNSPEIAALPAGAPGHPAHGLRHRLHIHPDAPLFVYVGALEPGRGIEMVLDAFTRPDIDAHVAFVGAGGLETTITAASDLHSNVHICPPVPHDQLVPFIRDATGGFCLIEDISLSDHYCLPNKLFEYAFAGLPVIASRLPEIERVVREYHLGVCADLNPTSIGEAIAACSAWPRDLPRERLKDLAWESQAEDLRDLYENLLHDGAPAEPRPGPSVGFLGPKE